MFVRPVSSATRSVLRVVLIVLPLVLIALVIALSSFQFIKKKTAPGSEPTAAEVAERGGHVVNQEEPAMFNAAVAAGGDEE